MTTPTIDGAIVQSSPCHATPLTKASKGINLDCFGTVSTELQFVVSYVVTQ